MKTALGAKAKRIVCQDRMELAAEQVELARMHLINAVTSPGPVLLAPLMVRSQEAERRLDHACRVLRGLAR